MSHPIQDHADAFLALARAATGSPALTVYDGAVSATPPPAYALMYFYIETPGGLLAPDKVPLTMDSDVIEARAYMHCVGADPEAARAARAVSGRVRTAVLNQTLTIPGRTCFPIRWIEGRPPQRDEETGRTVMTQVDVYGWTSVPG